MTRAQRQKIRRRRMIIRKIVESVITLITGILLFGGIALASGVIGPNDEINMLQGIIGVACMFTAIPLARLVCKE